MIRTSIRRYSAKNIPFEAVPKNRYNQSRSAFNFKPKATPGLVHNPSHAIFQPSQRTPRAFLPPSDPRLQLQDAQSLTREDVEECPLIYNATKREYDLTPEIVSEIVELRTQDPATWTVGKLAKKFGIEQHKVNVLTATVSKERKTQIEGDLDMLKSKWSPNKTRGRSDRSKRLQMWLRNEF